MMRQQHRGHDHGDEYGRGHRRRHPDVIAAAPQQNRADPEARGERRGERHGVVRVQDAVGIAEGHRGDHQPAAPQDQGGPRRVRARGTPREDRTRPRGTPTRQAAATPIGTHRGAEQPAPADIVVQVAQAAGLVTGEPAQPVVAQGQLDDAVVLRSADVRDVTTAGHSSTSSRYQPPDSDARADGGDGSRSSRCTQRRGGAHQVRRAEAGQHQERLQHLGEEAEADRGAGPDQPPTAAVLFARPLHAVGAGDQQQHQQCVRVVEAEHQRRHGRQREDRPGEQCRARVR